MSEVLEYVLAKEAPFQSKTRISSLYSDFSRIKSTNPDGYAANVDSWTSAVEHACRDGVLSKAQCAKGVLSFHLGNALADELSYDGLGRPLALNAVAEENTSKQQWIPLEVFRTSTTSVVPSTKRPAFHVPTIREVAEWGLRRVGMGTTAGSTPGEFVALPNVEAASKRLVSYLSQNPPATETSRIHSLETFVAAFSHVLSPSEESTSNILSDSDVQILLLYLSRDKHLISYSPAQKSEESTTIKLPGGIQTLPSAISENDIRIAQLKTLLQTLSNQIIILQTRIKSCDQQARAVVSSDKSAKLPSTLSFADKSQALKALRQKKAASATLEKRQTSFNQIDDVLQKIDDAASQVEIVSALENGAAVLKDLNKQVGGLDRVDEVMDKLNEEMANVEETGSVLAEQGRAQVNESEIEDELEALEAQERDSFARATTEKQEAEAKQARLEALDVPENTRGLGSVQSDQEKKQNSTSLEDTPNNGVVHGETTRRMEIERRLKELSLDE